MQKLLALCLPLLVLSSCGSGRLYEWGGYDHILYAHYKTPGDAESYAKKLDAAVRKIEAKPGAKVPPGLYAECGYALLELGKHKEAVAFFQKERAAWPESSVLTDKLISKANGTKKE
jgi:hypothetical protein